ncbi:KxYKxGKxW signal peptide domain-containing protein [Lactovum odontotermitis]
MKKTSTESKHVNFRIWKSGKKWLFAGAVVVTALAGGALSVSADTNSASEIPVAGDTEPESIAAADVSDPGATTVPGDGEIDQVISDTLSNLNVPDALDTIVPASEDETVAEDPTTTVPASEDGTVAEDLTATVPASEDETVAEDPTTTDDSLADDSATVPETETTADSDTEAAAPDSDASTEPTAEPVADPIPPDTIVLGGIEYHVTPADPEENGPYFANTITNTTTGKSYTYSFEDGTASTSYVAAYDSEGYLGLVEFGDTTVTTDETGRSVYSHTGYVNYADISVIETLVVYSDGRIVHNFTANNYSDKAITGLYFVVELDTMLTENDDTPIYADGNGGAYIQTHDGVTLWNQPLSNVTEYAGYWRAARNPREMDWSQFYAVAAHAEGTMLYGDASYRGIAGAYDTAIVYRTPAITLEAGQSYSFSLQERLYTDYTSPFEQDSYYGNIVEAARLSTAEGPHSDDQQTVAVSYDTLPVTGDEASIAPYLGLAALALAGGFAYGTNRVTVKAKKK